MSQQLAFQQKLIRQSIRNFLVTATIGELTMELHLGDDFRKKCVQELLDETLAEESEENTD